MRYIEFVNELIKKKVLESSERNNLVLFGQNITTGSSLSGLTRDLQVNEGSLIINTPNSENTLTGIGFGLMLNKTDAIFFIKQQDFLLLGIDHLVNTYNFIRRKNPLASFTIVFLTVDNGYQGLQSSLNNLGDFCSIARIPGFAITNKVDAEEIINKHLISPGFRIISVSQRLVGQELINLEKVYSNSESNLFQYSEGNDATIVCFNFSLPYGLELSNKLKETNLSSSLFSVNNFTPINWNKIIDDVKKTRKLVIIDDSKSENLSYCNLLMNILEECKLDKKIIIKRDFSKDWLSPCLDNLEINYNKIIGDLK